MTRLTSLSLASSRHHRSRRTADSSTATFLESSHPVLLSNDVSSFRRAQRDAVFGTENESQVQDNTFSSSISGRSSKYTAHDRGPAQTAGIQWPQGSGRSTAEDAALDVSRFALLLSRFASSASKVYAGLLQKS